MERSWAAGDEAMRGKSPILAPFAASLDSSLAPGRRNHYKEAGGSDVTGLIFMQHESPHTMPVMPYLRPLLLLLALSGCEQLGIEDPTKIAERLEAEGKAIGGACRHAGRALEDCFTLNQAAPKAAVFTGWREMNDYMTQNKIESVRPEVPVISTANKKAAADEKDEGSHAESDAKDDAPATKAKSSAKPKTATKSAAKAEPSEEGVASDSAGGEVRESAAAKRLRERIKAAADAKAAGG